MTQRIKIALISWLDPRAIILGFAVFNLMIVWVEARRFWMSGIAGVFAPWYCDLSYISEPTRLIIAAALLWLGRLWSYTMACLLSGYMFAYFVYLFIAYDVRLIDEWRYLQRFEPYLVGSFDSQYILALIIFSFAVCYLAAGLLRKYVLRNEGV